MRLDSGGKLVSWFAPQDAAYDQVMRLAWDFLLNRVPTGSNGLKAYYSYSYLHRDLRPADWPNNPADTFAGFAESALLYYAYAGDARVMTLSRQVLDYHLAHGMTPSTWHWGSVPFSSGHPGATEYQGADDTQFSPPGRGDGIGVIEPDKVGELAMQFLAMYQHNGEVRYRDAAVNAANVLASHVRAGSAEQSPWPFRVYAQTNVVREEYGACAIRPIKLFDELIRLNLGDVPRYRSARQTAWSWLMTYPMQNNIWANYFEDVWISADTSNWNQVCPLETARYLLEHSEHDPQWHAHVTNILAWVEHTFAEPQFGANAIAEQVAFRHVMGSHTARYGSVKALLAERTGDSAARDTAYRALNWATYMADQDGVVIDGPTVNTVWFTDGYGDYIRHFVIAMGAIPEWAPDQQDRMVRSTSVVKSIAYQAGDVTYETAEPASTEVFRLTFAPATVTANGQPLTRRSDLSQPGWTFDGSLRILRIRHANATNIRIIGDGSPPSDTTPPSVDSVQATNISSSGATISWTTNEPADSQVDYGPTAAHGSTTPVDTARVLSHSVTLSGLSPGTQYHYRVKSRDAAGNLGTSADATFSTLSHSIQTVSFDDRPGQDQELNGQYPANVIDWGTAAWWHSAPWAGLATKSVSFHGSGVTSRTFTFVTPRRLVSVQAFNGGGATTVTLSCAGQPTRTQAVEAGARQTIATGWTGTCTAVTVGSTNGWDTNFDDFIHDAGVPPESTPPPEARVQVQTSRGGAGRLNVALTGRGIPIRSVRFGTAANAHVEVGSAPARPGGFVHTPPSPSMQVTFTIVRQTPGIASTVHLVVVDSSGEWATFVGGGPNAF